MDMGKGGVISDGCDGRGRSEGEGCGSERMQRYH